MENLMKFDNTFMESKFKTNANNIFIQLYLALTTNNLDRVKHFISDEVYNEFKLRLDELNNQNEIQMFDEINAADINITDVIEEENKFIIKATLISKYLDYRVDKTTHKKISGNDYERVQKINYLTFEKIKSATKQSNARKCPACGANIDVNNNGKCPYCDTIYNLKDHDWILTSIVTN